MIFTKVLSSGTYRNCLCRKTLFSRAYSMNIMGTDGESRGSPMSEIIGSRNPWRSPEFPLVMPSSTHSVLYDIASMVGDQLPRPHVGLDVWDHDFVRMPCSSESLYPVEIERGKKILRPRWEMIQEALSRPIRTSGELAFAILSYNEKFRGQWTFQSLHVLFNEHLTETETSSFFRVTLREMVKLALALPDLIKAPIPLLKQHDNRSVSLSQLQIASLLANAFFCTFPRRSTMKKNAEYQNYPRINFTRLYESTEEVTLEKLKCICHYFRRVTTTSPRGAMTFSRRSVRAHERPNWAKSGAPLAGLPLHVDPVTRIEDCHGLIQVDFANKYLGGGVLGHGAVQEEIRFLICPELMISMLFTEVLAPHEALLMIGCERYSNYTGYSRSLQWAGNYEDKTPRDASDRRRCAVLAIDAQPFHNRASEFREESILRELNKAWAGVSFYTDDDCNHLQFPGLATGNWGCGAFGGTPQLKSLIQIMACAQARRPIAYTTFHDNEFRDELVNIFEMLTRYNITVGQLYEFILRFAKTDLKRSNLFPFIKQSLIDQDSARKPKNLPRPMDTVVSPDVSYCPVEQGANDLIQKMLNDSPDLFSQDEDQSQNYEPQTRQTDMIVDQQTESEHQMPIEQNMNNDNQLAATTTKQKRAASDTHPPSFTSLLFEQLQKFDEDNGLLNQSASHASPLSQTGNAAVNDSKAPKNNLDRSEEWTEVKRKKGKQKMTDYYSRKTD